MSSARSKFAATLRGPAGWEVEIASSCTGSDPEKERAACVEGAADALARARVGPPAAWFCSCNFEHKGVLGPCPLASGSAPRV